VKIGQEVRICSSVKIIGNGDLIIGDNTWIGPNVFFSVSNDAIISLEGFNDIAPNACLGTGSHQINPNGIRAAGIGYNKSIFISKGGWIGANALVLPGIKIGEGSIIGVGSVVTKNIPEYCIATGNPAKVIRQRCQS